MGLLGDIGSGNWSKAASGLADVATDAWDFVSGNESVVSGVAGVAGGIADYLGQQEANAIAAMGPEEAKKQMERHNKGIDQLAEKYKISRETKAGMLNPPAEIIKQPGDGEREQPVGGVL